MMLVATHLYATPTDVCATPQRGATIEGLAPTPALSRAQ
jgi:hypothetical protein